MKKCIIVIFFILMSIIRTDAQGKITAIEGGKVYIDLGEKHISVGDNMIVFTCSDYFTHPVTKELIPKDETQIARIEIKAVYADFSQGEVIPTAILPNVKVGMFVRKTNTSESNAQIPPSIASTDIENTLFEEVNESESEEDKYLKTMIDASNMNCPIKMNKDQTLEQIKLSKESMTHYYVYSKKYYKAFSHEKMIEKSKKDLTKSYRKEIKKDINIGLRRLLEACWRTNRYIEHVYYNPDKTESFSYRIYPNDIFLGND